MNDHGCVVTSDGYPLTYRRSVMDRLGVMDGQQVDAATEIQLAAEALAEMLHTAQYRGALSEEEALKTRIEIEAARMQRPDYEEVFGGKPLDPDVLFGVRNMMVDKLKSSA